MAISGAWAAAMPVFSEALGVPLYINARTDYFLQSAPERHDDAMVRAALERAQKRLTEQRSKEEFDFVRAQAALQRAMVRLKVTEYRSQH